MTDCLDLVLAEDCFSHSLKDSDDVVMDLYLKGYEELVKFLNLIGSVFSFVSSDVRSKMRVMQRHMEPEGVTNYDSFKRMMRYEKDNQLHDKSGFVSGSRTMLRLHRGLDFIRLFLRRLGTADDSVNTCSLCQSAYGETLALHHPWYIRKAATLAMHTLPARPDLLNKIFGSEERLKAALEILPKTLAACDEVYQRVETLYTDFDFHGLP